MPSRKLKLRSDSVFRASCPGIHVLFEILIRGNFEADKYVVRMCKLLASCTAE